jgi:nucleoid DNA-binding protein
VRRRNARPGFNPRTNSPMTIPAARNVGFRAAPELKKGL